VQTSLNIPELVSEIEREIMRLVSDKDAATAGLYAMCRYHLGLDGSGSSGKRMRPLLGLLAYASIKGEYLEALPGAAAVELGHNFSLVHDDIEDGDAERRHRPTFVGAPRHSAGDQRRRQLFTLSRKALHRLTDLGFSDTKSCACSASTTTPAWLSVKASTSTSTPAKDPSPCRWSITST